MENRKKTAVFFIPEAGITPYLRALCIVGAGLKNQGYEVLFTRCTGEMIRCPMICMKGLPPNPSVTQKKEVCAVCYKNTRIIQQKYGFSLISTKDLVSINEMQTISGLGSNASELLDELTYDGFAVGKVSQYDFGLEKKQIYNPAMDEASRDLFLAYIRNTGLSVAMGNAIQKRFSPDLYVTFNQYAQCDGIRYVAKKNGTLVYNVTYPAHLGFDGSQLYISKYRYLLSDNKRAQSWNVYKSMPIRERHVIASWDDAIFRNFQQGSHIYSVSKGTDPISVCKTLGLASHRKTIAAFTSSPDEIVGGEIILKVWGEDPIRKFAFSDQISWLKMLREFAEARDDIQIVVRIHPREGKNKNYSFGSTHLEQLRAAFATSSDNFIIVWPEDQISSYDLFEIASGVLIAWSTVGLEAARIGMPVLCYTENMCYPDDDFIMVAASVDLYRTKLQNLIDMDYKFEHLVKAIRFNYVRTFMQCLDVGETVSNDPFDNAWPNAPSKKEKAIVSIFCNELDVVDYNKNEWLKSSEADVEEKEKKAVYLGIRLFLDNTYIPPKTKKITKIFEKINHKFARLIQKFGILNIETNRKTASTKFTDYRFFYTDDAQKLDHLKGQTKEDKKLRFLIGYDNGHTWYIYNGKAIGRFSPLCSKLAKMACNIVQ